MYVYIKSKYYLYSLISTLCCFVHRRRNYQPNRIYAAWVITPIMPMTRFTKLIARSSLSDPALAYQSIGPGSSPAYTNEYFQYLSVLFCSAQEIQTSSNLKSLPPTVVAHDLKNDIS
ncbi:Protein of unknown function [Cotesia congregata]|uniref:Uncharacterized protein n=1 Tax=Cotesia congregata TaxID=51543 RepID=A0A8J2HBA6_COTCN|nr:Protein of unknown function [Cotesia congregata]